MDVDTPPPHSTDNAGAGDGAEKPEGSHPAPTKRYRLTPRMRDIIWELVTLSNEAVRIENEKKYVFFSLPSYVWMWVRWLIDFLGIK